MIAACAPLPDLSGYGTATVQVRQSVALTGEAVGDEIERAGATVGPENAARAREQLKTFRESWTKTVRSLDAMVDYANSLEAISNSGNKGAESARAVAGQVEKLANAVGVVPAAPVVGAVVDTAAFLYGELAKIRAAKSLATAVAVSGPSIVAIEDLVARQIGSARNALNISMSAQVADLSATPSGAAFRQRAEVRSEQAAIVAQLSAPNSSSRPAELKARLELLGAMHTAITPAADDFAAAKTKIETRAAAGRQIIVATQLALASWSDAHADVVEAIQNRRAVTLQSLIAAVAEVRTLVRKWEEL